MEDSYTTYYASPVGMLQLSSNGACISKVHFINEPLPAIPPTANDLPAVLQQCVDELIAYFQGALTQFTVPLQQAGSPFQQRVWAELLQIPFGKTISYQLLAKRLGDPKVIRAAASTNGKNNIAIIVPCHRVIGSHNDLVGYGGGLWRKRWLLEMEKKYAHGVQTLF